MQAEIGQNILTVKNKIYAACEAIKKDHNEITLIAVSKKKDISMIEGAIENGVYNFGENYAQELQEKASIIRKNNIIWHFIGPIQSNKVKIIAKNANWVHTLSREKIIRKLNSECALIQKKINACIQVNISSEDSKSGCNPDSLMDVAKLIESMKNINLKGIMALPKLTDDKSEQKKEMKLVSDLSKKLQILYPNARCISLGTTSDFENAIISGSTMVRVGESIFGKRL
jgi:pyridoxal phosphate enzyme (YggS family)|tara:strand:+ start:1881 stop:2567 length:687 start_codon:yes stop_codon:yes gene_type:complete